MPKVQDDARMNHYDIPGYEWKMKEAQDVDDGDLIPGHNGEVYEIIREAGMSPDLGNQYYLTLMVDDGDMNHMAPLRGDRDQINDAMRDRVSVEMFPTKGRIWTLEEE